MTPAQVPTFLDGQRDRLRRAMKIGLTIAAGSDNYLDMGMPQGEAAKHNLFAYAEAGMPNLTASAGRDAGTPHDYWGSRIGLGS